VVSLLLVNVETLYVANTTIVQIITIKALCVSNPGALLSAERSRLGRNYAVTICYIALYGLAIRTYWPVGASRVSAQIAL